VRSVCPSEEERECVHQKKRVCVPIRRRECVCPSEEERVYDITSCVLKKRITI
jgi:hypothetical protein